MRRYSSCARSAARARASASVPKRPKRKWGKTLMTVGLYGAAAVALWMGLWSGAWERLNTLPLQSGRYEAYDATAGLASGSIFTYHWSVR